MAEPRSQDQATRLASPPPKDDQSSRVVRGIGGFVLAGGVLLAFLVFAGILFASGQPNIERMAGCSNVGGSGVGNCGRNTMGGPALLIVVVGFGAAAWIWRRR